MARQGSRRLVGAKGIAGACENDLAAAMREFEETGLKPRAPFLELSPLKQKSGKLVRCWAFEGDRSAPITLGASRIEIEWPPGSGRMESFPEVDEARLFSPSEALTKILPGRARIITELQALLR